MKYRKEISGLHLFDRETGLHILFDEIKYSEKEIDLAPRTVSLAITNRCNFSCPYCYNEKTEDELDLMFLKEFSRKIDKLGCLEITIGGGEPLVHPELLEFCKWTWENTKLGINITTNGSLLTKKIVDGLKPYISSIRVSLNKVNNEITRNIEYANTQLNLGLNCIFFPNAPNDLIEIIEYAIKNKIKNILIIPLHEKGKFLLESKDWKLLKEIIEKYKTLIEIAITSNAEEFLNIICLKTESEFENTFINISAKKEIKQNSFDKTGKLIDDIENLESILIN